MRHLLRLTTPARPGRLLRKNKLDEIAGLRWSSFARLSQRMTGRSHRNNADTSDVDAAKSRHVQVQQAPDVDAGVAASDHTLDTPEVCTRMRTGAVGNGA
jgi:hypothetical protein